ncbi:protein-L-isoaspartate O-methyltransferase family protein [Hoeflea prorocentri]|uniref:Protein-L-isoaspartate O-methyltransferase n=1 Tax=Hoeflea prorocentri TaxID=1922333 RepID=A0A9X3UFV0_9HYPH|nr:protein-L-isoaspartate O-methyltransferase [Hoeflea prorocentri]MCY6380568.1 protein-L-isoaspartate O-methyltransferase [Hoeflea prorocentri]MDA5398368.1 protein-L-isoaspartate O-methyltransferase [Hoeflea prorocentri]
MDFDVARTRMVDNQIRTTDVTSHAVLSAFLSVAREKFVSGNMRALAYIDDDIRLSSGEDGVPDRYLMEPSPLAKMIQLAEVREGDVVLEIGCGTGYVSALLSQLADSVVALESDPALAETAVQTLSELGYDNVAVVTGKLPEGYKPEAPYDVIFIAGAVEELPSALFDQLRDGGRLVVVEGHGNASKANLYVREGGHTSARRGFNTSVKPLPGFEKKPEFQF